MARLARVVAVGEPHHLTQRGNNRQTTFLDDHDRRIYCRLLAEHFKRAGIRVLGYCLMSNHVHLAAIPERADSFARGLGRAHYLYIRWLHERRGGNVHLWQNRFFSCPLDRDHLWTALRYVDLNPLRAGLVMESAVRTHQYAFFWRSCQALRRGAESGPAYVASLAPKRSYAALDVAAPPRRES